MPPETDNIAVLSIAERERIEEILFQFDSSWSPEKLSVAVKSIPLDRDDARKSILEELVKIDIERRGNSGSGQELEDYLQRLPELGTRETVSPALIQTEYEARKQTDSPTSGQEIQKRFPNQFEELSRLMREAAKQKSIDGRALASLDTSRSRAADNYCAAGAARGTGELLLPLEMCSCP